MDIHEQERTYDGFMKYGTRATVSIIVVVALLAAFVA
ncbi:aa3-type cytochrome c oxidase subunit IV [Kordiimonas aestuarii]|nr:aa3-type cytochrome c oxidase subunit IV [Kordiimonas aestuarii]